MKKTINRTRVEGYVYEHNLVLKVTGDSSKNPGTEFISGTLSVATDDAMLNVVPVHFTYVTATTKNGGANATFTTLAAIIDGKIGSVMTDGAENAGKVRIDSAIGLNEWFDSKNNDQLVSTKRNEGGFVHAINELNPENQRATFENDIIITNVTRVEANEERNIPEKVVVKGCTFDFRNAILPVEFSVISEGGMNYFEGLEAGPKNPIFTRVKGEQVSQTVVREVREESAFGGDSVREFKNTYRDFVITWAQTEPYEWDSEATITAAELSEKMKEREVYLAAEKKRTDEYRASQGNAIAAAPKSSAPATKGEYNF